ncbi:hypothetical protein BGZ93_009991 [Podila epicladia]|nr:hypothetical protein BGZ92_009675 [Podila epicladia]KAG0089192.1 hypothetical protein BGZ93_009991 [Podila epicladia]
MEIIAGFVENVSYSLLEEATIDYQPYDDRDPWIFLLDIMEKLQKLPVPSQLRQVIAGATNIEVMEGLETLLVATQKCLALSINEAIPCKIKILDDDVLSQTLTKLKEITITTLPVQNTKDEDAKSDSIKENNDPQCHEVIFYLGMVLGQFKNFSSENEDLWTCIDKPVPPDEHEDHSIYNDNYQDSSDDGSDDDDDNQGSDRDDDNQGSDRDDDEEQEFKNGCYGIKLS